VGKEATFHGSSAKAIKMLAPPQNQNQHSPTFKLLRKICKETGLKEFQIKLIHGIVATKNGTI